MIGKTLARHAAALALAAGGIAAATPSAAQSVVASNPSSLVNALQNAGYKAVLGRDATGDPKISSAGGGTNFSIYFYGCTDGTACTSIQFSAGYVVNPKLSLTRINEWNATTRFAQAYLDKENDPIIQFDVVLPRPMSAELFAATVERWVSITSRFKTFIGFN